MWHNMCGTGGWVRVAQHVWYRWVGACGTTCVVQVGGCVWHNRCGAGGWVRVAQQVWYRWVGACGTTGVVQVGGCVWHSRCGAGGVGWLVHDRVAQQRKAGKVAQQWWVGTL